MTEEKRTSPTCTVHTRKSLMFTYVWLYIISVTIFLIAFSMDTLGSSYHSTYQTLMIIGTAGVLTATIICGFDRRCIAGNT